MNNFLKSIVEYHLDNFPNELDKFCFVFPSQRASHFFKNELKSLVKKPIWSPDIMTISEFFNTYNPTPISDNITLIFKLHQVYKEVINSEITIDEFIDLGDIFIKDFNDIDNYLVDAKMLMSNIHDIKEIENDFSYLTKEQIEVITNFWDTFNTANISSHQESFIDLWKKMPELYTKFKALLKSEGLAYQGMVARELAEKTIKDKLIETDYKTIVFAGFNALNKCEKEIFNQLSKQNKATFFWDYPRWIAPTTNLASHEEFPHEAYKFMQYNLENFPSPRDWENPFNDDFPDITIAAASNELEQSSITYDFLETENFSDTDEKTGVILADENMLLPVLYSIPSKYKSINITLGYPLKNTPAFALIDILLSLQNNTRVTKEGKVWFYHKDVTAVLRHQYINLILGEEAHKSIDKLIKQKQIFVPKSNFEDSEMMQTIFSKIETTSDLEEYLHNILMLIYKEIESEEEVNIEQEFIYFLYTTIKRLSDILSELEQRPSPETWQSLFKKIIFKQSVPFKGEPLKGLQIMGILESRAIDFENLIILGLTEGVFPKKNPPMTFIPFNLRKGYELPTIDNQDSIFAYYFYRLIHRAKNIKLIYTTNKALTEESEMSRFLQQLVYEYPGKIIQQSALQQINIQERRELIAEKNDKVQEILDDWKNGDKKLSPSALSEYLLCPLKFYYKYILKISESEELEEDLSGRVFGNIFHEVIQNIFEDFIGKEVTKEDIYRIIKDKENIKIKLQEAFDKEFKTDTSTRKLYQDLQGKNILVFEIIFKYIIQLLKIEANRAPFTIIGLEKEVKATVDTNFGTIHLGGKIDRVDKKGKEIIIADYKTGRAENSFIKIEDLFNQKTHDKTKAIFQTLLYSYILDNSEYKNQPINPNIIPLRSIYNPDFKADIIQKKNTRDKGQSIYYSNEEIKKEFTSEFLNTINELFNPEISFKQTEVLNNCKYCPYKAHCYKFGKEND